MRGIKNALQRIVLGPRSIYLHVMPCTMSCVDSAGTHEEFGFRDSWYGWFTLQWHRDHLRTLSPAVQLGISRPAAISDHERATASSPQPSKAPRPATIALQTPANSTAQCSRRIARERNGLPSIELAVSRIKSMSERRQGLVVVQGGIGPEVGVGWGGRVALAEPRDGVFHPRIWLSAVRLCHGGCKARRSVEALDALGKGKRALVIRLNNRSKLASRRDGPGSREWMSISQTPHWSPHMLSTRPRSQAASLSLVSAPPANGRAGCAARKAACVAEWLAPITACPAGARRGRNSLAHDREPDRAQLNCPVWKGLEDVMSKALRTQLDLTARLSLGSARLCVGRQARGVCDTPVPPLIDVHAARCWPDLSASTSLATDLPAYCRRNGRPEGLGQDRVWQGLRWASHAYARAGACSWNFSNQLHVHRTSVHCVAGKPGAAGTVGRKTGHQQDLPAAHCFIEQ